MPNVTDNLKDSRLTENLNFLMSSRSMNSSNLAREIGSSSELITKLKNGNLKNPTLKMLIGISRFFGLSIENLVYDNMSKMSDISKTQSVSWPVIKWQDINDWIDARPIKYIQTDIPIVESKCFAVEIPYDLTNFMSGGLILVDTATMPKSNSYVLVFHKDQAQFHIKKLLIDEVNYLQSQVIGVNNIIEYDKDKHQILGVVVGYKKDF